MQTSFGTFTNVPKGFYRISLQLINYSEEFSVFTNLLRENKDYIKEAPNLLKKWQSEIIRSSPTPIKHIRETLSLSYNNSDNIFFSTWMIRIAQLVN